MFGELWDDFKRAITPESHAEALVNEIYSAENRGMLGTPGFNPEPKLYPAVSNLPQAIVKPAATVIEIIGGATDVAESKLKGLLIWAFAGLVVLAAVYGFFGRR